MMLRNMVRVGYVAILQLIMDPDHVIFDQARQTL